MLWYKGWLETRYRLLFMLAIMAGFLIFFISVSGHEPVKPLIGFLSDSVPTYVVMICAMFGGAGIATQPPFQAVKGLHGSTLFTLSLPVSRFRLLAVRASLGWLEMAGVIGALCCGIWFAFPDLRAMAKVSEMFQYAATLIACASAFYSLSVLAGTFLDDLWRTYGTMIGAVALMWGSSRAPSIDVFRAMGRGSSPITHTMPWGAVAFSLGLAVILLLAALKIAKSREY
jgi:hypothetical protein